MEAITSTVKIRNLRSKYHLISYPEFQREPTVWGRKKKQLLVDSILRGLDIGNIYVVAEDENGEEWQCVDGQQRLNAIFSFLGVNPGDSSNNFKFRPENELLKEDELEYLRDQGFWDEGFAEVREWFLERPVRVIILTNVDEERGDLNLQFQRLQVAQILNGAEKLNAMRGEMRDRVFGTNGLGEFEYFRRLGVRNARYGGQQTAAQAVLNAVSWEREGKFCRARFADMQIMFKEYYEFDAIAERAFVGVKDAAEWLAGNAGSQLPNVRNRALAVSLLLFRHVNIKEKPFDEGQWGRMPEFLDELNRQMKRVGERALQLEEPSRLTQYEQLQIAVTQASVERPAIERRHAILTELFEIFLKTGELPTEPMG